MGMQARCHLEPYLRVARRTDRCVLTRGCPIGVILAMPLAQGAEVSSNVPKRIIGARK